ncbi:flippase [Oceanibacterium hippocampi]|uniref:Colanic acid exporter n=1 Tax=Oceanibacterium hippocampi TaxID=745714 RepID=A0A1Y5SC74_9PROT|nr:flippase [Oceanibacterium hippocampi]SLN34614.1 colanic acid exporter [Oceanibacterium hippocampi]
MTASKRAFGNVLSLGAFKVVADVLTILMFVFLARHFGQEGLGHYAFAMAFTSFVAMFANFGLESVAVREVARDPSLEARFFSTYIIAGLALTPVLLAVTALLIWALDFSDEQAWICLSIGAYQILYFFSLIMVGRLRARNMMREVGILEVGLRFAILAGTIVIAFAGLPLDVVVVSFPIATAIYLIILWLYLDRALGPIPWRFEPAFIRKTWPELWPFGLAMILHAGYVKIDMLMLGLFRPEAEVGTYAAAYRPIYGVALIIAVSFSAAYPVFSQLFVESRESLSLVFSRLVNYVSVFCGLAGIGLIMLAKPVIQILYGGEFTDSILVMRLFAIYLVLTSLNVMAEHFLGAVNRQRTRTYGLFWTILLNIALNLNLIPRYGYYGAIIATFISEGALMFMLYWRIHRDDFRSGIVVSAARVLVASGAAIGVWYLLRPEIGLIPATAGGTATYLLICLATGAVRVDELRAASLWIRRKSIA